MEEPETPRRICDVPSAKNLKHRGVFSVREWPPGCGPNFKKLNEGQIRNSSEEKEEEGEIVVYNGAIEGQNGDFAENGVQSSNDGNNECVWKIRSNVLYPPPKKRAVCATREYPPGCGGHVRDANTDFGENVSSDDANLVSNDRANKEVSSDESKAVDREKVRGKGISVYNDVDRVGLKEVGREKVTERDSVKGKGLVLEKSFEARDKMKDKELVEHSNASKNTDVQEKGATKPMKFKFILGKKKPESSTPIVNTSNSQAEVASDKGANDTRPRRFKVVAKKRVRSYPTERNLNESDESEAETSQAITPFRHPQLRNTARKSVLPITNTSRLALSDTSKSKAIVVHPFAPAKSGKRPTDPRAKVKRCLFLFQTICRKLTLEVEAGNKPAEISRNRIDLRAANILKEANEVLNKDNPIIGSVPGVEVGDEFRYRAELSVLGLHRPPQAGIDSCEVKGVRVANSVVASGGGGYSDDLGNADVLIYTGAGGQPNTKSGRYYPEDQKMERGNLALKESMNNRIPVRVIRGVNTSESTKVVMTFTYDGLYMVEKYTSEKERSLIKGNEFYARVFKFHMRRIPGQPDLTRNKVMTVKRSELREGLVMRDISGGKEKMPICVINTINNERPPFFKYVTKMIYPSLYDNARPMGCKCREKCSVLTGCECVDKNGEIAYNLNGTIIQAKSVIYECGPVCRCSKSCPNSVTQHGIQIPLEIFKTKNEGWGVRSLNSIQSGTFVCEYVGELLRDKEVYERENSEYLFDIGQNYTDVAHWGDLPSFIPGINSESGASSSEGDMRGYKIDSSKMGNVARFINHSCTPNLFAQNVLFDHDDKKMAHIMLFAAETIPALKELTYHYSRVVGTVRDSEGNLMRKEWYCRSPGCRGRLY